MEGCNNLMRMATNACDTTKKFSSKFEGHELVLEQLLGPTKIKNSLFRQFSLIAAGSEAN